MMANYRAKELVVSFENRNLIHRIGKPLVQEEEMDVVSNEWTFIIIYCLLFCEFLWAVVFFIPYFFLVFFLYWLLIFARRWKLLNILFSYTEKMGFIWKIQPSIKSNSDSAKTKTWPANFQLAIQQVYYWEKIIVQTKVSN